MRVHIGWILLLSALLGGGVNPVAAAISEYPFKLVNRGGGNDSQVVAENNGPAPITVYVTLSGENFASDRQWPVTAVIPPYTALALGRVYPSDPAAGGHAFRARYLYHFGRVDAVHDAEAVYRLPFQDGHAYLVSQAYGSKLTSHNNRAHMYAVDFALPSGTAVIAARAGVVIDVTLNNWEGGYDKRYIDKANMVVIVHDDGTVAEYAHLSPGPKIVTVGQRVTAGELIGYSGNTGYSSGPHLHFMVSRPSVSNGEVTLVSMPVAFYANDPGVRFSARTGTTVWANYAPTATTTTRTARANTGSTQPAFLFYSPLPGFER